MPFVNEKVGEAGEVITGLIVMVKRGVGGLSGCCLSLGQKAVALCIQGKGIGTGVISVM
ncbi:protein of unknown function [Pseudodesulfovibrio piezophilus C1TLV30]|uniref:Uncharacterized protein n=1 Tax=Pseudodesulfovibrio piezophilus (strain DSM 21447 / JCM 15486 / C1TLV30) TaxID=1322246 RepID=M1WXS7_PSEP2|nr:protein of unknown function [Pseudodesulfovibrio piezophilus C1TLV30]